MIDDLVSNVRDALNDVCDKPKSRKRIHRARRALARLDDALADLSVLAPEHTTSRTEIQKLRRRAGKVRDADVLTKIIQESDGALSDDEIRVACDNLHARRKRGLSKFLKGARRFLRNSTISSSLDAAPPSQSSGVRGPSVRQDDVGLIPHHDTRRIIAIRYAQTLAGSTALADAQDEALHAFRLACKQLRYTLQRFNAEQLGLTEAEQRLGELTRELGAAHDRAVLHKRSVEWGTASIGKHAMRERQKYVRESRRLWRDAFRNNGAFEALTRYAGLDELGRLSTEPVLSERSESKGSG